MKLLVIEDEEKTGHYLRKGLVESGFTVDLVHCGIDGRHFATTEFYDLVIMDVMLPDLDGWQVLKFMREGGNLTPVLFLTARDSIEDRVQGLDLGADDYLVKPFAFSELLARIRSLLRRGTGVNFHESITVEDLVIDINRRTVIRGDHPIKLTAREFTLLELLARRQGEVIPRSIITSQVWDMNFDGDANVVDVAIRRLRAKVDEGYPTRLIHTIRGMGYKLQASEQ
ncbi:heavy metal response regulator transcription factor [Hahella ganghwensis]|uniref:heavy metal response regulator transcription factor n=1 Tax=Hahella ganghwensis TaxID=286420 RepID=UPI0003716DFB|nr:heavy metal response regulator transcription factor [Hahella ganghwensis]